MLIRSRQSSINLAYSSDNKMKICMAKLKNSTKLIKLYRKGNKTNLEINQKTIKTESENAQPTIVVASSEAERHLNFNPLPNQETQKKIDYFLSPYNKSNMITRYMNFNERDPWVPSDITSKEKWSKISKLILNQDKHSFRKTLRNINDKLYTDAEKQILHKQEQILNSGKTKRLRFADGSKKPSRKKSSYNKVIALAGSTDVSKRNSVPHNQLFFESINSFQTVRGRKSIISQAIDDIREKRKEQRMRDEQNCGDIFDSGKVLKRSKTVHMRRNDINMASPKINGIMADIMSLIPESTQKYSEREVDMESRSEEFDTSVAQSRKIECNSELILKLLNRDHHIFKKNKSQRNLIKQKVVEKDYYETTKDCTIGNSSSSRNKNLIPKNNTNLIKNKISNASNKHLKILPFDMSKLENEYFVKISKDDTEPSFLDRCADESDLKSHLLNSIKNPGKSRSNQVALKRLIISAEAQNQSDALSSKMIDTFLLDREPYSTKSIPILSSLQDSTTFSSRFKAELLTRDYVPPKVREANSCGKSQTRRAKMSRASPRAKERSCLTKDKITSFV